MYQTLTELPVSLSAGAAYPDSKDLRKLFTYRDRFGSEYCMYSEHPNGHLLVPRNCAPALNDKQAENRYEFKVGPRLYEWHDGFEPRHDEQRRLVDTSVDAFINQGSLGHILQAPTGFGKTWVGSAIAQRLGVRTLVLTTKEDILHEWKDTLVKCLNIPEDAVGEWRGRVTPKGEHQVVVGLVQSVCKGPERYDPKLYDGFGLVIVDEVHRIGADEFSKAMWYLPARFRLGLSATPYRKDGREKVFEAHIGEVIATSTAVPLKFKVLCYDTGWEVPIVWQFDPTIGKSVRGPLHIDWGRVTTAVKYLKEDAERNSIVAEFVKACYKKGRNIVVMSATVEHLENLKEAIRNVGVPEDQFGWYIGLTSKHYLIPQKDRYENYRKDIREQHTTRPIVMATDKMCGEGTNVPWWDTLVLSTPKADVTQQVGRILREYEGKQEPLVLDLCDYEHKVLSAFCGSRRKWYKSMGAEIVDYG